jgi:hypothetical protein
MAALVMFMSCQKDYQEVVKPSLVSATDISDAGIYGDCPKTTYLGVKGVYPYTEKIHYDHCTDKYGNMVNGDRTIERLVNPVLAVEGQKVRIATFGATYVANGRNITGYTNYIHKSNLGNNEFIYSTYGTLTSRDKEGNVMTSTTKGTNTGTLVLHRKYVTTGVTRNAKGAYISSWNSYTTKDLVKDKDEPFARAGVIKATVTIDGNVTTQIFDYSDGTKAGELVNDNKGRVQTLGKWKTVTLPFEFIGEL